MSPEVYRLLTGDRGWPAARYEQWLKNILIDQLLPPSASGDDHLRTQERHARSTSRAQK
jgi:hypothetical protein